MGEDILFSILQETMKMIDLDGENDPNFLSLLEPAEADALVAASATKNKRKKIFDQEPVEVEGSYFALRGNSLWQHQQEKAKQRASSFTAGRESGVGAPSSCMYHHSSSKVALSTDALGQIFLLKNKKLSNTFSRYLKIPLNIYVT